MGMTFFWYDESSSALRCEVVRRCVLSRVVDDGLYLDRCEDGVGFADDADDD